MRIERFADEKRIEPDDALAQRQQGLGKRDGLTGRRRECRLAARVGDDREPPARMCGQEPNDGNGIARRPPADDRVDDRQTLAVDPPHFMMSQVRGGRVGEADAVFRLVASSRRDASQRAGLAAAGDRSSSSFPGSRSGRLRAGRGSSDRRGAGCAALKVNRSSGFSGFCSPSWVFWLVVDPQQPAGHERINGVAGGFIVIVGEVEDLGGDAVG